MDRHTLSYSAVTIFKCVLTLAATTALHQVHASGAINEHLDLESARAHYGATGEGVLVALIDQGIDWRNQDFRNADGTTRIEYLYDLTNAAGSADADNPFGVGTVHSKAEIDAALAGDLDLSGADAHGSATAVAGIAVGNGRNSDTADFEGVAPEASIIAVKAFSHGVPAHGTTAAEPYYFNPSAFYTAIDFVALKSIELGMPAVVFLNYDRQGGPTDGTSFLSKLIDDYSENPGLIFVTGTGASGGIDSRAAGTINAGETATIQIEKNQTDVLDFDLWYTAKGSDGAYLPPLTVSIKGPDGTVYGPYAPSSNEGFVREDLGNAAVFTLHHRSDDFDIYVSDNGLREILVRLRGGVGQYEIVLALPGAAAEAVNFDANLSASYQAGAEPSRFLNHLAEGSLWDGASTESAIVVTGFANQTAWTDLDGTPRSDDAALGVEGELATRVSAGPTFDGRHTTDVAAPAGSIFSTYPSNSWLAADRGNLIQDGQGHYGRIHGNGAAAASVAGLVALMLEQDPSLVAAEANELVRAGAVADAFTGITPNNNWGGGKINVLNSVHLSFLSAHTGPVDIEDFASPTEPITLSFDTTAGLSYKVQYQEAPLGSDWQDLSEFVAGDGSVRTVDTELTPQDIVDGAFFRVVLHQPTPGS